MINKVAEAFPGGARIRSETLREISLNTKLYVVFIIARSGSTWLMEMAANSGVLGTPQEWFNESWIHTDELAMGCRPPLLAGTASAEEYIRRTVEDYRARCGVMGLQLSPYQAECLCEMLEKPSEALGLVTPFYLRRRNLVAQAISLYRSMTSGFFHSYQEGSIAKSQLEAVEYDADAIQKSCDYLLDGELFFESLFERFRIRPARFCYEDIVGDPRHLLAWIAREISPDFPAQRLEGQSEKMAKLGGKKSTEWEFRFRIERAEYLIELESRRPTVYSDVRCL